MPARKWRRGSRVNKAERTYLLDRFFEHYRREFGSQGVIEVSPSGDSAIIESNRQSAKFTDEELSSAWEDLSEAVRGDPQTGWMLLIEALDRDLGAGEIECLAAGPAEDFIDANGPVFIDLIEEESARNPKLSAMLRHVWINFEPESDVAERLHRLGCPRPKVSQR